jgi:hypothetical protein
MTFSGERRDRGLWYEWAALLLALQWERPIDADWDDFRAEWFRALFDEGKEAGFAVYEKR